MALEKQMQSLTLNKPYERRNATLFHLFACYPVCDRICFYLCIGAIIALSRTCKALSRTYRDLLLTQWNIDTKLSRFVTNPRGLRLQLRDREAVISGSFAVQFFDRTVYPDSDLDIFIEHGDHGQGFLEYLTSTEGYQLAHSTARSQLENDGTKSPSYGELRLYHSGAVQMVRTYLKKSATDPTGLRIQIIETTVIPIALILSSFYATHVVNVITWSRAYAVFPIPTFVHHKGHMLEDLSGKHLSPLLRKWATRGWEFDQTLWPEEETSTHSIQARRRVADKYTWKISHDTTDLRLPGARAEDDHGIGHNVFEMDKKGSHYLVGIGFPNFESPVLMHTYVVPTASWFYFLDVRLRRAIYMQLLTKLDPSEWPESGPRSKIRVMRHKDCYHAQEYEIGYLLSKQKLGDWQLEKRTPFERPENWRYLDDEIPRWYEIWKEEEDWAHGNAAVCSGSGWERWEIRDREF